MPQAISGPVRVESFRRRQVVDRDLVFDIGMELADDSAYYLKQGLRVIAFDPQPGMVERAKRRFAQEINLGRFQVVPIAVGDRNGEIELHISSKAAWTSLIRGVADREGMHQQTIKVPIKRLDRVFQEHGVPYYCKIDIEGYDAAALSTLEPTDTLPPFISVETECAPGNDVLCEEEALRTLEELHRLGYGNFRLVDQGSLSVLPIGGGFYNRRKSLIHRIQKHLPPKLRPFRGWEHIRLCVNHNFRFPKGSSGPFGQGLAGPGMPYEVARETLLRHRKEFFSRPDVKGRDFWCDWHAELLESS